jgi:Zn-finger nucleic acid-binding protein
MKCPNCKEVNLVMSDRQGVEIDYCPECRGVWLDRGELDKIIERSAKEESPRSSERPSNHYEKPYDKHHDKHYEKPYKKKSSWLSDLFD